MGNVNHVSQIVTRYGWRRTSTPTTGIENQVLGVGVKPLKQANKNFTCRKTWMSHTFKIDNI